MYIMLRYNKKILFLISLVLALTLSLSTTALALPQQAQALHKQLPSYFTGEIAYDHVYYLSEEIGRRGAATQNELEAAKYIERVFLDLGYEVDIQPFSYVRSGREYNSQNVIAVKQGRSSETVIIGAHYDSVANAGRGAGDNATGIGVMLEVASLIKDIKTHATIKFVAFGAEEAGLRGSRAFVAEMTEEDIENTIAMINMDMVGIGDNFHVYSAMDTSSPAWVSKMALDIGMNLDLDIRTTVDGTTGDWSDHAPFSWVGIPVAYFEWWNSDIDYETVEYRDVYHTNLDTIDMIGLEKLRDTGKVVVSLVYELARTPLPNMNSKGVGKRVARYKAVNSTDFDSLVMERE